MQVFYLLLYVVILLWRVETGKMVVLEVVLPSLCWLSLLRTLCQFKLVLPPNVFGVFFMQIWGLLSFVVGTGRHAKVMFLLSLLYVMNIQVFLLWHLVFLLLEIWMCIKLSGFSIREAIRRRVLLLRPFAKKSAYANVCAHPLEKSICWTWY